jgi:hypothetical protein
MTPTTPLPPLPDLADMPTTGHPALDQILTDLTNRPADRVAFYDDSPYIAAAHTQEQR